MANDVGRTRDVINYVVHIYTVANIFATLSIFSYLYTCQIPGAPPADVSSVSGFYGPGAYIAWLLTFACTAWDYELPLLLRITFARLTGSFHLPDPPATDTAATLPLSRRSTAESSRGGKVAKADLNVLASVAYPVISLLDCLVRLRRRPGSDAQLRAAGAVCSVAMALCALMIIASNLKYVYGLHIPAEEGGKSPRRGSPVRLTVWWLLLLLLCSLVMIVPESDWTAIGLWLVVRSLSGILVLLLAGYTSRQFQPLELAIIISVPWLLVGLVVLLDHREDIKHTACANADQGAVLTLALNYPRTGAKVTDLDQVSAIAVAVLAAVFTAWGGGSKVRKWWRRTTRS